MAKFLAVAYLIWSVFIAVGAGYIGSILNCEYSGECEEGSPSWFAPWTWGSYYVFPEAGYMALAGVVATACFVGFLFGGRRIATVVSLILSLVFLSYPFFGGLTSGGVALFWFGPILGIVAAVVMRRRTA